MAYWIQEKLPSGVVDPFAERLSKSDDDTLLEQYRRLRRTHQAFGIRGGYRVDILDRMIIAEEILAARFGPKYKDRYRARYPDLD